MSFCLLLLTFNNFAQSNSVPYTLEDRDRNIRMEERLNSLEKSLNERINSTNERINSTNERINSLENTMMVKFDSQQQQINDIKLSIQDFRNLFYWAFGIMITLMLFLFGFIIWDRRTTTEPIREHTQSLMQTLREYAKDQPKLADILRSHGIM